MMQLMYTGSCRIRPYLSILNMTVHFSTAAHSMYMCLGSEIETGRCGESLSSQPDFCSSSDCIMFECLDLAQVVTNIPACQFRKDQVDCFRPSEEQKNFLLSCQQLRTMWCGGS